MTDLIERLRRYQHDITRGLQPDGRYVYELTGRAADEIERLTIVAEQNRIGFEKYERLWYLRGDEIERLRAALQAIIDDHYEAPAIAAEALKDD